MSSRLIQGLSEVGVSERRTHLTETNVSIRSGISRPASQTQRSLHISPWIRQRIVRSRAEASTSGSRTTAKPSSGVVPKALPERGTANGTLSRTTIAPKVEVAAQELKTESASVADDAPILDEKFWAAIPKRYRVVLICTIAYVICNMDKVSMSVAIIPMAKEYGWDPSMSGAVQSSFFAGYMMGQIPGGLLSSKFGGAKVLPVGVFLWSAATAAVPLAAQSLPALFLARFLVGLGEGISPTAVLNLITTWVPQPERSRALATAFGGLNTGTVLGLTLAPFLIKEWGWQPVFYSFGVAGIAWCLLAPQLAENSAEDKEAKKIVGVPEEEVQLKKIPWRSILTTPCVQALMFTHFVKNWGFYTLLSWLPSFYSQKLDVDLTGAALLSLLPPVTSVAASGLASLFADNLIEKGVDVTRVRKLAQGLAFLGPAAFFSVAGFVDLPSPLLVGCITMALGLGSFSVAGLYSNHSDISPKYSSILLGITNTCGSLPGLVGVTLTGYILSQTDGDWSAALFTPAILMYLLGSGVYLKWGSAEPVDFDTAAAAGASKVSEKEM